jgi:sugar fermentation stimulation protein A
MRRTGLVSGTILQRYKRFLADVELPGGPVVTAHCTNTGTMATCWEPGDLVLLEPSPNPERKLKFTWLACRRDGAWVGVETGMANRVVAEAARQDRLPGLPGLCAVRTEQKYGAERSRIDVLAEDGCGRLVYIEVKNTTLRVGTGACFPDAVTLRGAKHLRELRGMVRLGHRAALVFFVQRGDADQFDAAREIDPAYALELERAAADGVAILPVAVSLRAESLRSGLWTPTWSLPGLLPWVRRNEMSLPLPGPAGQNETQPFLPTQL